MKTTNLAPSTKTAKKNKAVPLPQPTSMPELSRITVQSLVVKASTEDLVANMRLRVPAVTEKTESEIAKQPIKDPRLGMGVAIYCREAVGVACVVEKHRDPSKDYAPSFGPHQKRLGGDVGPTIVYLVDELRVCENMLAQTSSADSEDLVSRCIAALVELRTAGEVVVDDGIEDEKDVLMRGLRKKHASHPKTHAAIANALASYVTAARSLSADLAELEGFDMTLIDRAQAMADTLMGRPAIGTDMRSVRQRRNRIAALLQVLVNRTRKLGRFVFRQHPEVVREMASTFHRNRRIAERGQQAADDTDDDLTDDTSQDPTDDTSPDDETEETTPPKPA